MDKRKKTCLTLIALGCLFMAWRVNGLLSRSPVAAANAEQASSAGAGEAATEQGAHEQSLSESDIIAILHAQQSVVVQPWGRDPFDPTQFEKKPDKTPDTPSVKQRAAPPPSPVLTFHGVSKAGDRWLASVNSGIVSVGDVVMDHYQVAAITTTSITLVSEGWAYRYELGEREAAVRPVSE